MAKEDKVQKAVNLTVIYFQMMNGCLVYVVSFSVFINIYDKNYVITSLSDLIT